MGSYWNFVDEFDVVWNKYDESQRSLVKGPKYENMPGGLEGSVSLWEILIKFYANILWPSLSLALEIQGQILKWPYCRDR